MASRAKHHRAAYTIAELLVLMAVVAIAVAVVVELRNSFSPKYIQSVALTVDGSRAIAVLSDGGVVAWDTTTGEQSSLLGSTDDFSLGTTISPDGRFVARTSYARSSSLATRSKSLCVIYDLQTGNETRRQSASYFAALPQATAFSPDGKQMALVDLTSDELRIIDPLGADTPDIVLSPLDPTAPAGSPASVVCLKVRFAADGKHVLVFDNQRQIQNWNLETQQAARGGIGAVGSIPMQFDVSPVGDRLAVLSALVTLGQQKYVIDTYDLQLTPQKKLDIAPDDLSVGIYSITFCDSGKSLAVLGENLEIWDVDSGLLTNKIPLDTYFNELAVARDSSKLALSDGQAVFVVENSKLRKLGTVGRSHASFLVLIVAFVLTNALRKSMRKRRTMNTCVDCGKKWQEPKRRPAVKFVPSGPAPKFVQCPDCRLESLATDELRQHLKKRFRSRMGALAVSLLVLPAAILLLAGVFTSTWLDGAWFSIAALGALPIVIGIAVFCGALVWQRIKFRRLNRSDFALRKAQQAAAAEGRFESIGSLAIWTDLPERSAATELSNCAGRIYDFPAHDVLAAQLADCREQLESILGSVCPALPPSQMFIFATTAAGQKFLPSRGLSNETPAVYCGPWANVGCISIEGLRKQLRILSTSVRSLMSYQSVRWPRYGFWLGYGLYNHVARLAQPDAIDACRRRIAAWAAEGSLLPLAQISRLRLIRIFLTGASASLPENYGRRQRIMNEWLSLVDYFCGADATPERREQFRRLWQVSAKVRKFDRAVQEACDCSLVKLDADWKAWAAAAKFEPPVAAPPEIAATVRDELIPLIRNEAAPIQRRIRAIRILGGSGYSIGAHVLLETFSNPHPDLQLEALAAVRQLSGHLGSERAADWDPWLSTLPEVESCGASSCENSTLAAVTG